MDTFVAEPYRDLANLAVSTSEATCALVREATGRLFDCMTRGKVQAKGKGEMEMFFVRHS